MITKELWALIDRQTSVGDTWDPTKFGLNRLNFEEKFSIDLAQEK